VLLIAALGFVNYVLLKMYGARGFEVTGFLGGLVNSTVTVTELAQRDRESEGELGRIAQRGVILATTAMILRNAAILLILAPAAIVSSILPFFLMVSANAWSLFRTRSTEHALDAPRLKLRSPFSVQSALKFGLIFLALQVTGTIAERLLGGFGFYLVSLIGGLVSSASAVAAAAMLCARHQLPTDVAATAAVVASIASTLIHLPLVARVSKDQRLTRRVAIPIGAVAVSGAVGIFLQKKLDIHLPGGPTLYEIFRNAFRPPE
jgi:uncharacterized membrane protein (DUF4010 family)